MVHQRPWRVSNLCKVPRDSDTVLIDNNNNDDDDDDDVLVHVCVSDGGEWIEMQSFDSSTPPYMP